jgi:predicted acylesterase/phospholipase RssA
MSGDPTTYDYSAPTHRCDIVMKGGITSGVVYPHAVCELAQKYSFQNVGGASAGAIAAAAAAAAEFGRSSNGFKKFAGLPDWIGADSNLFSLFQPQRSTRRLYRTFTAGLGGGRTALLRILLTAMRNFPLATFIGAAPGIGLIVLGALSSHGILLGWSIGAGILLTVIGLAVALTFAVARNATAAIPANCFGLCSGAAAEGNEAPALTPWLSDLLDDYASVTQKPLTFGDLWAGPSGTGDRKRPVIRLEMMTTNLTNRRPHKLPWDDRAFFFNPDEFDQLFPARIVEWMKTHPPSDPDDQADLEKWQVRCELLRPLLPLPPPEQLPVVVAARMSLSFPVLISAIPLWSVDMSRKSNRDAWSKWKAWLQGGKDKAKKPSEKLVAERCWFSDGGISSNFPVHFFDAPIPRWPTFAIDLMPFHPDYPQRTNECDNVWLPNTNVGGLLEAWYRFDQEPGRKRLVGFVNSMIRTMQNRVDSAQMRVPGYRDRIVHISNNKDEGGMNLSMPQTVITALTERGRCAGIKLVERFATPPASATALSWDNHRWVRYRSTLAALSELIQGVGTAYSAPPVQPGDPSYADLVARPEDAPPASYRWSRADQRTLAVELTRELVKMGEQLEGSNESFAEGAPRPNPEARIVPRV